MSVRKSWAQEMESVYLYEVLADSDSSPERRALFTQLAGEAKAQAAIWAAEARKIAGETPEGFRPSARARFVAVLVRRLGPERLRSVLAGMKVRGMSVYRGLPGPSGHAMPHSVEEVGRSHRDHSGGDNLRPAVFGASDGLVSNLCLILGVAGASASSHTVLITGVAGLLAGAFSMAAGEYVSVRSQREMFEHQIGAERDELRQYPEQEAAELSLIYQARGLSEARRRPRGHPPDRRSRPGARHAGARGAGARSGRARIARPARRCRRSRRSRSAPRCRWRRSCSPRGAGRWARR